MKPTVRISHDEAKATSGKYNFYYGFADVDAITAEWKFTVDKSGKRVFELTNSELMALCDTDTQSPESMLLTGILTYLSK
jgi:hypothetical protein